MAADLARLNPREFCNFLNEARIRRFYLVWNDRTGRLHASHPQLEPLAASLQANRRDFDGHEAIFAQIGPRSGVLQAAFIHRSRRGQAAGGVRLLPYASVEDLLRDGLRLSRAMTQKTALAGLWWGGGKGVLTMGTGQHAELPHDQGLRRTVYEEFGSFVTSLRGCYVTAEDYGTRLEDMAAVFSRTRYTTCIPEGVGGSGDPVVATARGVLRAMEAALEHVGRRGLRGRSVAVQGVGHVGEPLVRLLEERGVARIVASDMDPARKAALESRYAWSSTEVRVEVVDRDDNSVLAEEVDIVAPCATGGVLNERTIPSIKAPVVCGAANNQLEDPERDSALLAEHGIAYVPDFLCNRMGIVTCADEGFGRITRDPTVERHLSLEWDGGIFCQTARILADSARSGQSPHAVACQLAERMALDPHPIWGHRGLAIIRSLVEDGWERGVL